MYHRFGSYEYLSMKVYIYISINNPNYEHVKGKNSSQNFSESEKFFHCISLLFSEWGM